MANIRPIWEVVKTSLDLTDIALFFTPVGGGAVILGAINWARQNIPTGSLIMFTVGLFLLAVPLIIFAIVRFTNKVKRQLRKPEAMIFPYIEFVNASLGKDSVLVNYHYPSALQYDLMFIKTRCSLTIASVYTTQEQEMPPLVVKRQANNYLVWEFPLGNKIDDSIKQNLKNKVAMQFKLNVSCWSHNDETQHNLSTEEKQIIAL